MKFSAVFVALVTSVLPVLAAPAPEAAAAAEIQKRDLSVYVCEHANWGPRCVTIFPPWNVCQPFSATGLPGYQSWGPGEGTTCLWYTGGSCTGTQSDAVNYPGFSTVPGFWQFNTASFKCWN
ncbi:hypothetical protein Hypma_016413 [Hypsizygus marmoreus]|uniref:Secreted protein n=1 Tax=Hypsizygus marmoreus TaxID=39966 RepID=A0A369IXR3_HYPMA|nr:hypothetical protein Hypma_016413 [Hypsizygus marmoreus]